MIRDRGVYADFRGFAAQAAGEYPRLARWVKQGWNRERF